MKTKVLINKTAKMSSPIKHPIRDYLGGKNIHFLKWKLKCLWKHYLNMN